MVSYQARLILAAVALAIFVVIVATQSLLVPSYDSAHQEISEYVHSSAGGLMVIGFLAWALSWAVLAMLPPATDRDTLWIAGVQRAAFASTALGLIFVACFATDRGTIEPGVVVDSTTAGRIHDAASALVTLSIIVAALAGATLCGPRTKMASLLLVGMGLSADVIMLGIGDPAPGIRQRLLVAAACLWQVLWLAGQRYRAASTA